MDCLTKLEMMGLMQKLHSDTFDAYLVDSLAEICEVVAGQSELEW